MSLSRSLGSLVVRIAAEGIGAYKSDLNTAADATTQAGGRIERSYDQTSKAAQKASQAQVEASQKSVDKLNLQADTFGSSARESTLYKMALEGATASQLKQADAALKSVEAMKQGHQWGERMGTAMRVGALLAVTGAVAAAAAFESLIGSVAKYQDLAEQTGGDPAGLASLRTAADVGGSSIDSLALSASRLQANLAKVDDESKGVGQALAAIGIEVEAFKNLRPDEQLREIGKALNQYADGGEKVAVIQGILGRGSQVQLSALKELGNETQSYNTLTNAQIALADDYKDAQARSRSELMQTAESIATQMLPALTALTGAGKDVILEILGVSKGASDLGNNKAIQEWAKDGALVVAAFADVLINMVNVARVVGTSIRSIFADVSLVGFVIAKAGPTGAGLLFQKNRDDIALAVTERNAIVAKSDAALMDMLNGDRVTTALKKQFSEATRKSNQGVYGGIPSDGKAAIDYNTAAASKGGRAAAFNDEANAKIEALKRAQGLEELLAKQSVDRVTSEHRRGMVTDIDFINQVAAAELKAMNESITAFEAEKVIAATKKNSKKEIAAIDGMIAAAKEKINGRELQQGYAVLELEAKIAAARQAFYNTADHASIAQLDGLRDKNTASQLELEAIGLTKELMDKLTLSRQNDAIATQAQKVATMQFFNASGQSSEAIQIEIDKLNELKRAKGLTADIQAKTALVEEEKKAKQEQIDLWKQIDSTAESVFMDIANNGTSAFKRLESELKNGLLKLLYEMTVKKWIISIGSDMAGFDISGLLGGGSGGGDIWGKLFSKGSEYLFGGGDAAMAASTFSGGAGGFVGPGAAASVVEAAGALEGLGAAAVVAEGGAVAAGASLGGMATAALAAVPVIGWIALGAAALFAIFGSGKDKIPTVLNDLNLFNQSLAGLPFQEVAYSSDEAAQGLRDVLYGLENATPAMRRLAGETIQLTGELMRAQGNVQGARDYDRNIASRGLSKEELAMYDYNQALKDKIQAERDGAAAASAGAAAAQAAEQAENTLAQTRYDLAGRLNVLLGRQTQQQFDRAKELAGATDAAVISMLNEIYKIEDLTAARDASFATLERSIAAEKKIADVRLKSATDLAAALKTAKDAISPSLDRASAQSQIAMYVALAKAGGVLPTAAALKPALDAIAKPSEDLFRTFEDYALDQAHTANDISDLAGFADAQVSEAQQAIERLDLQLETAKNQLDVLKGVDNSVLSVAEAVRNFEASMLAVAKAQASAGNYSFTAPVASSSYSGGGGGGGYSGGGASSAASATAGMDKDIVAAFNTYYGRDPDKSGYDHFISLGLQGDAMMQAILKASIANKSGADYNYALAHGYDPENPLGNYYHGTGTYKATAPVVESYDVGSNYIERDQIAQIHQGEEITPRAYVDMQRASRDETNALMARLVASNERLEAKVAELNAAAISNANHNSKTASLLDDVINGGRSISTTSEVTV